MSSQDASEYLLRVIGELRQELGGVDMQRVCNYLNSGEADLLVRSMALALLTNDYDHISPDLIVQLEATLCLQHDLKHELTRKLSRRLIEIISSRIRAAIANFESSAPTEYQAGVDRAMAEKDSGNLQVLARQAHFARGKSAQDLANILDFTVKYRSQLAGHTSEIVPAYFDVQRRVPISKLYIEPQLRDVVAEEGSDPATLTFQQFVSKLHRSVVLGDPGAGKSTLAQKLTHDMSQELDGAGIATLPFIVAVRLYEAQKRGQQFSITHFIGRSISENFHLDPPAGAIDYLLLTDRSVVIFDGLDELLDLSRRREVCTAIESFCRLYPTARIVATSRRIGYDEAPLNPLMFRRHLLQNFSDDDVRLYAEAWFSIDNRLSQAEQRKLAHSFCRESLDVPDLRRNALMLGLMCNLYRGITNGKVDYWT